MINAIASLLALLGRGVFQLAIWFGSTFNRRWIWVIIALSLVIFITIGFVSFGVIYGWLLFPLVAFSAVAIWVPVLRGFLGMAIVSIAFLFFTNEIVIQPINGVLSNKFPSYKQFVGGKISNLDIWMGETSIMDEKKAGLSEKINGTFGALNADAVVYTAEATKRSPRIVWGAGEKIKKHGKIIKKGPAKGLVKVVVADEDGDFYRGRTGYIPVMKIDWDNSEGTRSIPQPPLTEDEKMLDLGAVVLSVSKNVSRDGFVKILLPSTLKSGDNVEFLNFLYDMEEVRGTPVSHGMAISGFTVNSIGNLYMVVRPYGKVPDKIWAIIR